MAVGTLGGPWGMAAGALGGTVLGTGLDRAPAAARNVANHVSGLFSHFTE
jgi:hypothetical protein